ncbi:TlpA disulfide reductase family protein [Microbulbifer sp. HZ11]|uniref:TlpA family protein disulfide reductase n=1 Tax=Microbulbifer sp. HZ11 TaxID=1453501 RepID=UPI0009DD3E69|nr:TlpA disulfide reductase family protein [Microbulbifer sp. HZ11]
MPVVASRPAKRPNLNPVAALLLLIALAIGGCESRSGGLTALNGDRLETGGKVLLVNYWAEWCAPCREEIPELNDFYREHGEQVLVLGINFDQPPAEEVQRQAEKFGIAFPLLAAAPEGRWGQAVPQVLPSTFIIDRNGQWRRTLVGPQTATSLQEAIRPYLEQ